MSYRVWLASPDAGLCLLIGKNIGGNDPLAYPTPEGAIAYFYKLIDYDIKLVISNDEDDVGQVGKLVSNRNGYNIREYKHELSPVVAALHIEYQ